MFLRRKLWWKLVFCFSKHILLTLLQSLCTPLGKRYCYWRFTNIDLNLNSRTEYRLKSKDNYYINQRSHTNPAEQSQDRLDYIFCTNSFCKLSGNVTLWTARWNTYHNLYILFWYFLHYVNCSCNTKVLLYSAFYGSEPEFSRMRVGARQKGVSNLSPP